MTDAVAGLVVIDKPDGMTSHDVVARMRRIAGTRKVGHAGTLDPMATGVLVLGLTRATRLLGHLTLASKAYTATVRLGRATTTDDAEGEPLGDPTPTGGLTHEAVVEAFESLQGEIEQRPSSVSAIKVGGKRAYARVRDGEDVVLPSRPVTIHSLRVVDSRAVDAHLDVDIEVECSSGTYIRAIARDVGETLGVGGHLTALRRTRVGPFTLADAPLSLDEMAEGGGLNLVSMADAGRRFFPFVDVDETAARDVGFGRPLDIELPVSGAPVAVFAPSGDLLALYESRDGRAVPVAVLA